MSTPTSGSSALIPNANACCCQVWRIGSRGGDDMGGRLTAAVPARLQHPVDLVGDVAGDRQRRRRARRRRVAHVQGPLGAGEDEVVDEPPVASERLRADPGEGGLDVGDGNVYVSEDAGAVTAFNRSGASLWRQDKLAGREPSAPLALGPEIVVGDVEGYVHWLAREDGAFVARQATDGSPIRAAPVPIAGGFLVQTSKGGLYALHAE